MKPGTSCFLLLVAASILGGCTAIRVDNNIPPVGSTGPRLAEATSPSIESSKLSDVFSVDIAKRITYRIPALLRTSDGALLAFAERRFGSAADSGNIDVVCRRSADGGRSWSVTKVAAGMRGHTIGNPCVVQDRRTGAIILAVTGNLAQDTEDRIEDGTSKDSRRVYITMSHDDGRSWAPLHEITAEVKATNMRWYATGPGIGVQLGDGRLVIPCDHTVANNVRTFNNFRSHIIYSDDDGASWHLGGSVAGGTNECQVVVLQDDELLLSARNYFGKGCRAFARSTTRGVTWGGIFFSASLPDPTCEGSVVRVGGKLFASGPNSRNARRDMALHESTDNGRTWRLLCLLHTGSTGYSSLAVSRVGELLCLYEAGGDGGYQDIVLSSFHAD